MFRTHDLMVMAAQSLGTGLLGSNGPLGVMIVVSHDLIQRVPRYFVRLRCRDVPSMGIPAHQGSQR